MKQQNRPKILVWEYLKDFSATFADYSMVHI
jgi:hypothetical protein